MRKLFQNKGAHAFSASSLQTELIKQGLPNDKNYLEFIFYPGCLQTESKQYAISTCILGTLLTIR